VLLLGDIAKNVKENDKEASVFQAEQRQGAERGFSLSALSEIEYRVVSVLYFSKHALNGHEIFMLLTRVKLWEIARKYSVVEGDHVRVFKSPPLYPLTKPPINTNLNLADVFFKIRVPENATDIDMVEAAALARKIGEPLPTYKTVLSVLNNLTKEKTLLIRFVKEKRAFALFYLPPEIRKVMQTETANTEKSSEIDTAVFKNLTE